MNADTQTINNLYSNHVKVLIENTEYDDNGDPIATKPVKFSGVKDEFATQAEISKAFEIIKRVDKESLEELLYAVAQHCRDTSDEDSNLDECAEFLEKAAQHLAGRGTPY